MKYPSFKFSNKGLSKYRGILKDSVKTFSKERPYDYHIFEKNVKSVEVKTPPDHPENLTIVAWHDDSQPNTVFLSEKEFGSLPPEKIDKQQIIKALAHEEVHSLMVGIPDTPEEEKKARSFENSA